MRTLQLAALACLMQARRRIQRFIDETTMEIAKIKSLENLDRPSQETKANASSH